MVILFVSSSDKSEEFISEMLKGSPFEMTSEITIVKNSGEARRLCNEREFDAIIVNTPLRDEFGLELACDLAEGSYSGVILLAKAELIENISSRAEYGGVVALQKPVPRTIIIQALRSVAVMRNRLFGLHQKYVKLEQKIEEIRICDRAKCVLIQFHGMTEEESHRYIEKEAMDNRVSKKEIAENILRIYS